MEKKYTYAIGPRVGLVLALSRLLERQYGLINWRDVRSLTCEVGF